MPQTCPLCHSNDITDYHQDKRRKYLHCQNCDLVFVPAQFWPTVEAEKAVYDYHQNSRENQGYCDFLSRLADPLLAELPDNQSGLDFGCGPGPTLSVLLQEAGHQVELYDHFYFNNPGVLEQKYDFITATEVAEHLQNPEEVFSQLFDMLKPGGWLGIMTKFVTNPEAFRTWHYIRDKTHIRFYSEATMKYIAQRFGVEIKLVGKDVVLFRKSII